MKSIKTANGVREIDNWDDSLIPIQLCEILHEHRSALITKLLGGLDHYLRYKLCLKVSLPELKEVRKQLYYVLHSGIDMHHYESILEQVLKRESIILDSALFYEEIDGAIKRKLEGKVTVLEPAPPIFNNRNDLIIRTRRDLVSWIQTEAGLKEYVMQTYNASIDDQVKLLYLLDEIRDYFKNETFDYRWLLTLFKKLEYRDWALGNKSIFDGEVQPILNKHFTKIEIKK